MAEGDAIAGTGETGGKALEDLRADKRRTCGMVMPIASMGEDYPEAHWSRVRRILQRAIERAGLRPQLVWENPEVDVIQAAILQNIYENDVVICDVSNLNPNVMLETGLRLSTKRPTIIVTDRVKRPPFDIGTIGFIDYQRDLEFNAIEDFIARLTKKIQEVSAADIAGRYQSYVEQFKFETVQPTSVSVPNDLYIRERLDELTGLVGRLSRAQRAPAVRIHNQQSSDVDAEGGAMLSIGKFEATFDDEHAHMAEMAIDSIPGVLCFILPLAPTRFQFDIQSSAVSDVAQRAVMRAVKKILEDHEGKYLLS